MTQVPFPAGSTSLVLINGICSVTVIPTTTITIAGINAIIATSNVGRTLEWAVKKVKVPGLRRVPEANPGT